MDFNYTDYIDDYSQYNQTRGFGPEWAIERSCLNKQLIESKLCSLFKITVPEIADCQCDNVIDAQGFKTIYAINIVGETFKITVECKVVLCGDWYDGRLVFSGWIPQIEQPEQRIETVFTHKFWITKTFNVVPQNSEPFAIDMILDQLYKQLNTLYQQYAVQIQTKRDHFKSANVWNFNKQYSKQDLIDYFDCLKPDLIERNRVRFDRLNQMNRDIKISMVFPSYQSINDQRKFYGTPDAYITDLFGSTLFSVIKNTKFHQVNYAKKLVDNDIDMLSEKILLKYNQIFGITKINDLCFKLYTNNGPKLLTVCVVDNSSTNPVQQIDIDCKFDDFSTLTL